MRETLTRRRFNVRAAPGPEPRRPRPTLPPTPTRSEYAVAPEGIFYVACNGSDTAAPSQRTLRYRAAKTGEDRIVGAFEAPMTLSLAVSPDGKTLLYDRSTPGFDLMMIENFR